MRIALAIFVGLLFAAMAGLNLYFLRVYDRVAAQGMTVAKAARIVDAVLLLGVGVFLVIVIVRG